MQRKVDEADAGTIDVSLKLYASLGFYLPEGAVKNIAELKVPQGTLALDVLDAHNVPPEKCHLVLVIAIFIQPASRATTELKAGAALPEA